MPTLGCLTLTAVAALILVLYEPRRVDPLIELRFFASAPFCGAVLVAICAFGAYSGVLFLNTLYLQSVRGLTPLQAGLCTLPLALMMATFLAGVRPSGCEDTARGRRWCVRESWCAPQESAVVG